MSYRGGERADQRPPYRYTGFGCPPPATTPRPVPAAVFRASASSAPQASFSPATAAVPVTTRTPSSASSPAPAPRELAQSAPTRACEPGLVSSPPSAAALAKEKKMVLSETALVPPAAAAAAPGAAASDAVYAAIVDLVPDSNEELAHPALPGLGTVEKMIRANHLLVVADNNLFHYDVT